MVVGMKGVPETESPAEMSAGPFCPISIVASWGKLSANYSGYRRDACCRRFASGSAPAYGNEVQSFGPVLDSRG